MLAGSATEPRSALGGRSGLARLPILLIGHFDTVLSAATPRREGDRLVATGAIDMKGGIVAFLKALDLVARRGGRLPALRLVLVPDEEVGGAISRRAVATAGAAARALWVLEPGEPHGRRRDAGHRAAGDVPLAPRGAAAGPRTPASPSGRGGRRVVAIAEWIQRAAALSRPHGGPTVNVARVVAGETRLRRRAGAAAPPAAARSSAPRIS